MTAPDARNDAVQFLYKHGELTYGAAAAAIAKLCNNGFYITRAPLAEAHPLAAEARMALERDDVAGWIGSLPKAPLAEALAVPTCDRPFIMGANHGYDTALEQVAELLEAMKEVLRISDRDHAAWHRAHAALRAIGERAE